MKVSTAVYPSFCTDIIDELDEEHHCCLQKFSFRTKGKRRDDLIAFGSGETSKIAFYENPRNHDFDEGYVSNISCVSFPNYYCLFEIRIDDESELDKWHSLTLQTTRYASSCEVVDITGNGFHDRT